MPFCTRREFARLSLAALPGAAWLSSVNRLAPPNNRKGSQIPKCVACKSGLMCRYSFANQTMSGDEILRKCVQLGISGVELRNAAS